MQFGSPFGVGLAVLLDDAGSVGWGGCGDAEEEGGRCLIFPDFPLFADGTL